MSAVRRLIYLMFSRLPFLACLALLLQSAGSLAFILAFCVIQSAGVDIHPLNIPWVEHVFTDVYRIDPSSIFAKTRFDGLFVPLVVFYVFSLPCLAASIFLNLRVILKDIRQNWRLLGGMAFFLFGLWLELFIRVPTSHRDLQQTIIDGGVAGYVILFVIIPMALAISAAELLLPKHRSHSNDK